MPEVQPPLFVEVDGVIGADELGLPFRDIMSEGVLDLSGGHFLVSAPGGMVVRVAKGAAWIKGDDNTDAQPTYRVRTDGAVDLAIAAADGANPRKDIVIAEVLDAKFAGSAFSWRFRVITGNPAPVPVEPGLPNNAIKLAVVQVPALAAAIVGGNLTDTRGVAKVGAGQAQINVIPPTFYPKVTQKDVVNTVTETDLLNGEITIEAGKLVSGKILRARLLLDVLNNTGSGQAEQRFKVKLGGTLLIDTGADWSAATFGTGATRLVEWIDLEIHGKGSSSQFARLTIKFANANEAATGIGDGRNLGEGVFETNGDPGIDMTVARLLEVTVINPVASANFSTRLQSAYAEVVGA
jgi:hypothetical protein